MREIIFREKRRISGVFSRKIHTEKYYFSEAKERFFGLKRRKVRRFFFGRAKGFTRRKVILLGQRDLGTRGHCFWAEIHRRANLFSREDMPRIFGEW